MNEGALGYPQKIVTCCYCGTRAALVLKGRVRHELSCSSCGAPLRDLKMLPRERTGRRGEGDRVRSGPARPNRPANPARPRRKVRKSMRKFLKDAVDLLEDIFD